MVEMMLLIYMGLLAFGLNGLIYYGMQRRIQERRDVERRLKKLLMRAKLRNKRRMF